MPADVVRMQILLELQLIEVRFWPLGATALADHVLPPSSVRRKTPAPTANPCWPSANQRSLRIGPALATPLHETPPSSVWKIFEPLVA